MNPSNRRFPLLSISFFLLIGSGALLFALWLIDHRQALPNPDVILAALGGVVFISLTGAFIRFLRWRDVQHAYAIMTMPHPPAPPRPDQIGTIYGLMPGVEYRVVQSFTDFYGNSFEQNEILRFKSRNFLPYDSGHTIFFEGRTMYLQEERNSDILDNFSKYLTATADENSTQHLSR